MWQSLQLQEVHKESLELEPETPVGARPHSAQMEHPVHDASFPLWFA